MSTNLPIWMQLEISVAGAKLAKKERIKRKPHPIFEAWIFAKKWRETSLTFAEFWQENRPRRIPGVATISR